MTGQPFDTLEPAPSSVGLSQGCAEGADSNVDEVIQLRLKPGSLEELLSGQYGVRFWLVPFDDGSYGLSCVYGQADPSLEALLRMISRNSEQIPIVEPSAEVAELIERWDVWFDELPDRPE